ncbi:plus-3 domain-containing family protein [Salix suchowensis]|nr:plus-3 domain-containing family protein [Salix suchowensis]
MADLENLLLEAAGRTGKSGRNRNSIPPSRRRKREGSYSDGGSDSRDDDSDDDRGYVNRKPSGSQVPLKKRLETNERDDEGQGEGDYDGGGSDREGGSSDESDIGDDLYKDEDDRQKLAQMSELDRELILADRADKKGDKHLTEKIRSKRDNDKPTRSRKETPPLPSSRGVRSSARSADRAAAKDDALNELRAKRLKQQDPEAHRKLRDVSRGSTGSRASLSSSSSESGSRSHSEDEGSTGDGGMADSDEDVEPGVGIGRSKSGSVYRLCMVRNVDAAEPDKPYKLENKSTYKYLNVTWGADTSAARWQMAMVSDSGPTEEEYKQWVREVERGGGRLPSKQDISEKKEAIRKSNTFVYSAATVKQMLQEKKSASSRPLNVAAEKDRLRRELEIAQSKHDEAEVERINARIEELEASRHAKVKDAKAIRSKSREAGYDPFSRRWTRSKNYYVSKPAEVDDPVATKNSEANDKVAVAASNQVVAGVMSEAGVAATEAALEAAADAGKLVDTRAPVDQGTESNTLHSFELEISLTALQRFSGPQDAQAVFMARKQRIEATVGCRVPENDGRRHALTLTVGDYKRRRGLL